MGATYDALLGKLRQKDTIDISNYVPYTGATTNVDLGIYSLTATTITDGTFSVTGGAIIGATGNISMWTNDAGYLTSLTPAGADKQIQFNNAGAFGADSNLNWDNTNKMLGIGTAAPTSPLHIFRDLTGGVSASSDYAQYIFTDMGGATTANSLALNGVFIYSDLDGTLEPTGSAYPNTRGHYVYLIDDRVMNQNQNVYYTMESIGAIIFNKMVFTGAGTHTAIARGGTFSATAQATVNNAGATLTNEAYGFQATATARGTKTSGTINTVTYGVKNYVSQNSADTSDTTKLYGEYIDVVSGKGSPNNEGYGIWINSIQGSTKKGIVLNQDGAGGDIYFGAAQDAYLQFDGNSLNIVANAVTATDDLEITAGTTKISSTDTTDNNRVLYLDYARTTPSADRTFYQVYSRSSATGNVVGYRSNDYGWDILNDNIYTITNDASCFPTIKGITLLTKHRITYAGTTGLISAGYALRGLDFTAEDDGVLTAGNNIAGTAYGIFGTTNMKQTINSAGKTYTATGYGGYFGVNFDGDQTAGTLNQVAYGNFINTYEQGGGSANQANSVTAYGLYLQSLSERAGTPATYEAIHIQDLGGFASTWGVVIASDSLGLNLGASKDILFNYDGTNTVLQNLVGTGIFDVQMTIKPDAYQSSDGSAGITTTFTNGDGATVTVKDGLITNIT